MAKKNKNRDKSSDGGMAYDTGTKSCILGDGSIDVFDHNIARSYIMRKFGISEFAADHYLFKFRSAAISKSLDTLKRGLGKGKVL